MIEWKIRFIGLQEALVERRGGLHGFKVLSLFQVGLSIAFLNAAGIVLFPELVISITSAFLGSFVTVLTSFNQIYKFEKSWANYSRICGLLKREKIFFLNSVHIYSDITEEDKRRLFVERIEHILQPEGEEIIYQRHANKGTNQ